MLKSGYHFPVIFKAFDVHPSEDIRKQEAGVKEQPPNPMSANRLVYKQDHKGNVVSLENCSLPLNLAAK